MKKSKTICLIDDEEIVQFIVKTIVKKIDSSINLLFYKNGEEAISLLKQSLVSNGNLPDIILLDINMPVMGGWQFLDEFIKIKPQISKKIVIYILSSSTSPEDIDKSKMYKEISGYLCKPIDSATLRRVTEFEFRG